MVYCGFLSYCRSVRNHLFRLSSDLPEETELHGWLLPANEATPANGCDNKPGGPSWNSQRTPPHGSILFLAGTNGAWTTSDGKSTVLQVGTCLSVSVEREGSQLAFDADVFDRSNELIARIEQNEFHLIAGKYSYQSRPNRSTLIVFDKHGDPLFVVWYLNPTTVKFSGVFVCSDKTKVLITNDAIILPSGSVEHDNCKGGTFGGKDAAFRVLPSRVN